MKQKALVTGGTGFIGTNLLLRLLKEGWDVFCLVRSQFRLSSEFLSQGVKEVVCPNSTEEYVSVLKLINPSVVFHLASLFIGQHKTCQVSDLIESNVHFGTKLLEAMSCAGVKRIVNTGTSWQHFNNEDYNPVCLYAATKQAFEDILKFYVHSENFQSITLEIFDTYGPNDFRPKILPTLLNLKKDDPEILLSPGEQKLDFVYIDDVIECFVLSGLELSSKKNAQGDFKKFCVRTGNPIKLKELVEMIEKLKDFKLPVKLGGRAYRPREVMEAYPFGNNPPYWLPKIGLTEGLKKTIHRII
ncbi:MAG: NAD(P)-dependent oxidoreductase [Candidatus Riflebacteria bacterium]|nr:NAD(P)-dependent oxidoreductase [Candidatus Riflebacteria bacterium]